MNRRKFLNIVGCCGCSYIINSCASVPITDRKQLNLIPHRFHCDLPEPLIKEIIKCKDNSQVRQVGIEWCIEQSKELKSKNVPFLHYYSMGRSSNIRAVAEAIF